MPLGLDSLHTPHLETFARTDDLFDWRLIAANNEVVCSSFQGFTSRGDAERAAMRARELFDLTTEVRTA